MDHSRRDFVKGAAALGAAATLPLPAHLPPPAVQAPLLFRAPPMDRVRIGFVGVGGQGSSHVENLLTLEGVEITALCDIVPEKVTTWQRKISALGRPEPRAYTRGPRDFQRLCAEE